MLIVVALSVIATLIAYVFHTRFAGASAGQPDLGWVSERWLAEYRADGSRPPR